jgi:hypothetical protein
MIELPTPPKVNGDTLRDELEAAGLDRSADFFISGDTMVFNLPDSLRDRLASVLQNHRGRPSKPPTTPDQVRISNLESWSVGVNATVDALIFDALLASLSDEDLLADLGGL